MPPICKTGDKGIEQLARQAAVESLGSFERYREEIVEWFGKPGAQNLVHPGCLRSAKRAIRESSSSRGRPLSNRSGASSVTAKKSLSGLVNRVRRISSTRDASDLQNGR